VQQRCELASVGDSGDDSHRSAAAVVAEYVYGRLGHLLSALPPPRVQLVSITVRENDRSGVTFSEA